MESYKEMISKCVEDALKEYGLVIALLIIGYTLGWFARFLLSDKKYFKQLEIRIQEKDQRISELGIIISDRLNKIQVIEQDKSFFKKLTRHFNNLNKKKK